MIAIAIEHMQSYYATLVAGGRHSTAGSATPKTHENGSAFSSASVNEHDVIGTKLRGCIMSMRKRHIRLFLVVIGMVALSFGVHHLMIIAAEGSSSLSRAAKATCSFCH